MQEWVKILDELLVKGNFGGGWSNYMECHEC